MNLNQTIRVNGTKTITIDGVTHTVSPGDTITVSVQRAGPEVKFANVYEDGLGRRRYDSQDQLARRAGRVWIGVARIEYPEGFQGEEPAETFYAKLAAADAVSK